jgi:hypothetical protein
MGEKKGVYRVLVVKPEGGDHLVETGIDGMIILRWIFRKCGVGRMDWIDLAKDRDRWRAFINAVMNLRVP